MGNQVRFASFEGAVQCKINITQPVPFPPGHPDAPAIELMNFILGGSAFNGRLMKVLREDTTFMNGARCDLSADPVTAEFMAYAEVSTGATESALVEILAEINRIRDEQVTEEELAAAKALLAGSFERSLENDSTAAQFALNIRRYALPEDCHQTYLRRIDAVTVEDIQRVAKNMIKPNNLNICVVGSPDILDLLKPLMPMAASINTMRLGRFGFHAAMLPKAPRSKAWFRPTSRPLVVQRLGANSRA